MVKNSHADALVVTGIHGVGMGSWKNEKLESSKWILLLILNLSSFVTVPNHSENFPNSFWLSNFSRKSLTVAKLCNFRINFPTSVGTFQLSFPTTWIPCESVTVTPLVWPKCDLNRSYPWWIDYCFIPSELERTFKNTIFTKTKSFCEFNNFIFKWWNRSIFGLAHGNPAVLIYWGEIGHVRINPLILFRKN